MLDSAMNSAWPKARMLARPWMIDGTITGESPSVGSSSSSNFGPSASARAIALERGEHTVSLLDPRCGRSRLRMHPGRQGNVFRHRQLPEDLALLRREADAEARDLVRSPPHEVDAVKDDRAGRRLAKTHDGAERRGLACTVATDQVHQLARLDLERDTAQHAAALHVDVQVLRAQHQCLLRVPITFSMSCGSAKNRSGGKSANTRPCESAMIRCE